jgi:EAL domain-containing protein (putative c-di-GMP-specific phosphodiesterase class I)
LREALLQDRFYLLVQPIVDLHSGEPQHWEVLLRLRSRDGPAITPGAFIPAAERYGVMAAIDRWVLRHALAHCHRLSHGSASTIALNLSASALDDDSLIPLIDGEIPTAEQLMALRHDTTGKEQST